MALTPEIVLAVAKKFTKDTAEGAGAVAGKPCQIKSMVPITGGTRVTYLWLDNSGTEHTQSMDVMDGNDGETGPVGPQGERGAQGLRGEKGEQGIQGIQGPQGSQGVQGVQGIQGIQGEKGDDGYPFLIYKQYDDISEFDESDFPEIGLMFMVMQEDFDPDDPTQSIGYPIYRYTGEGNPPYSLVVHLASQGIKGEKGDKGDKGDQGIQGPQGEKGDQGDQGIQGIQGEPGQGVPEGGTTGQVIVKMSGTDYDFGFKGTTDRVRPGSHDLVEAGSVYAAITEAVSSIYTPHGTITCAELVPALLIPENVKYVYNVSDSGETTEYYINGAGIEIHPGDAVGIIEAGPNTILFNYMGPIIDLTDYQPKDLSSPMTIGGTQETTVEGALDGLNGLMPAGATANNKLVTASDIALIARMINHTYDGVDLTQKFALEIALYSDEWAWVQARLNAHNVEGMNVGDYIPIKVGTETHQAQIAGINTYYDTTDNPVLFHIDWITRDCYGTTVQWNTSNVNNGTAAEPSPFLASNLHTWLIDTLYPLLETKLKNVIKDKQILAPTRYQDGQTLTDDNSWAWKNLGKLWVPFESEVFESIQWSTKGYGQSQNVQYPIFANSYKARRKGAGPGGSRCTWWLASATSGTAAAACLVGYDGTANSTSASAALRVPVCFRTMAAS